MNYYKFPQLPGGGSEQNVSDPLPPLNMISLKLPLMKSKGNPSIWTIPFPKYFPQNPHYFPGRHRSKLPTQARAGGLPEPYVLQRFWLCFSLPPSRTPPSPNICYSRTAAGGAELSNSVGRSLMFVYVRVLRVVHEHRSCS